MTAYELVIDCLPSPMLWRRAVANRRDGTDPDAVFRIIDGVRCEALSRLGDLAAGQPVADNWPAWPGAASDLDRTVALRMVIEFLPDPSMSRMMLMLRCDGCSTCGVFAAVDNIRRMLSARLDAVQNLFTTAPIRVPARA